MIYKEVNTENPEEHWEFIKCADKVTLDLGCGWFSDHRERSLYGWPTTPEWLLQNGATHVYAYDANAQETNWVTQNLSPKLPITANPLHITSVADIRSLLATHNPTVIKCDIEGAESTFLDLSDEEFRQIEFYALETHSDELFDLFTDKFTTLNYNILAVIDLVHAKPTVCKVIFAERIN